jgi:hypothetical protein
MKRAIIRGIWGIYDNSHRLLARRTKIDTDIKGVLENKFEEPFVIYVFGEENYKKISALYPRCILIHKEPFMFDLIKFQYRHKMEAIRYAMEEDKYDEIIWLDWDCFPSAKVPLDLWDKLGKKESFQACLQIYHKKKCFWRPTDQRKVPNGGFLYMRDKTLPSKGIKIWETMQQDNDEPAWAKMTDELMGGWTKDSDAMTKKYWEMFEPEIASLRRGSPYPITLLNTKTPYFKHWL